MSTSVVPFSFFFFPSSFSSFFFFAAAVSAASSLERCGFPSIFPFPMVLQWFSKLFFPLNLRKSRPETAGPAAVGRERQATEHEGPRRLKWERPSAVKMGEALGG